MRCMKYIVHWLEPNSAVCVSTDSLVRPRVQGRRENEGDTPLEAIQKTEHYLSSLLTMDTIDACRDLPDPALRNAINLYAWNQQLLSSVSQLHSLLP